MSEGHPVGADEGSQRHLLPPAAGAERRPSPPVRHIHPGRRIRPSLLPRRRRAQHRLLPHPVDHLRRHRHVGRRGHAVDRIRVLPPISRRRGRVGDSVPRPHHADVVLRRVGLLHHRPVRRGRPQLQATRVRHLRGRDDADIPHGVPGPADGGTPVDWRRPTPDRTGPSSRPLPRLRSRCDEVPPPVVRGPRAQHPPPPGLPAHGPVHRLEPGHGQHAAPCLVDHGLGDAGHRFAALLLGAGGRW
mmetsp:Transcript_4111/g.9693  ORF Transcript_4111/g.9693 Transcript_4111/m.9693 type:complete len:245 (-) Transcript_4111:88-822(-)